MFAARLIAIIWLLGATYILVASRLSPGLFGITTAVLAIPAGIGILLRRKWAVVPAVLLCLAWGAFAVLFMVKGAGLTLNNIVLLIAAVACGIIVVHWHQTGRGRSVWIELQ
ncbi:MAG: hypothetical protein M5U26_27345 [Planctomycetota bacterium]|nr:hypothetical protein [Planctomycetota bacterium]